MQLLLEQIINGCALGAVYGLFAIGFGLVFSTLGILNAAHGTYATFAAIAAYYGATALGLPFALTALVGVLSGAVLALVVDQLAFQPLRGRGTGMIGALITSIACWMVLDSLAGSATEQQSLSFPIGTYPTSIWYLGGVPLPAMQILAIGLLLAVTAGVHWLLAHSRLGGAMRAVGWNQAAAQIAGVNPRVVILATAALAGATSGLAGVLGGVSTNNVSASLGEGMLLKGFAAVVVGGFSDVRGAAVAGLGLGVAEVLSAQYISTSMRDAITYGLLLGFLVLRPRGLFGATTFVRA